MRFRAKASRSRAGGYSTGLPPIIGREGSAGPPDQLATANALNNLANLLQAQGFAGRRLAALFGARPDHRRRGRVAAVPSDLRPPGRGQPLRAGARSRLTPDRMVVLALPEHSSRAATFILDDDPALGDGPRVCPP